MSLIMLLIGGLAAVLLPGIVIWFLLSLERWTGLSRWLDR